MRYKFQEWFATDLWPCQWHTRPSSELRPTCKDLRQKEDPVASCVTHKWNGQVPRSFLTVKSGHGACWFQWRVGPSYCKYCGLSYDLLVSNIRGTYDIVDQLLSNCEFGHFLVVSPSGVRCKPSINQDDIMTLKHWHITAGHLWKTIHQLPGPWFNIKMSSYQYRKSHCGDKTVVRSSYLHNGISYTGKIPLYWIRAQAINAELWCFFVSWTYYWTNSQVMSDSRCCITYT